MRFASAQVKRHRSSAAEDSRRAQELRRFLVAMASQNKRRRVGKQTDNQMQSELDPVLQQEPGVKRLSAAVQLLHDKIEAGEGDEVSGVSLDYHVANL